MSDQSLLTQQLATRLVQGDTDEHINRNKNDHFLKPIKACIAVAGGGSNAASAIASTPGASSLLLESIVTYDRRSYAEFVSNNMLKDNGSEEWMMLDMEANHSSSSSGADSSSSAAISGNSSGGDSTFKFSSTQAVVLLARSALNRSLQLSPSFQDQALNCVGVGCTSSLVGKLAPDGEVINGRKGRKSRAYVAISTLREGTCVYEIRLDSGDNHGDDSNLEKQRRRRRRSRSEEEAVVSNLVLLFMMLCQEQQSCKPLGSLDSGDDYLNNLLKKILDREGDVITEQMMGDTPPVGEGAGSASAAMGASQIANGDADVVAVLPVPKDEKSQTMKTIFSDANIPFPNDVLIVPGSFNPPHVGHIGLANAAVAALKRLRQNEAKGAENGNNNNSSKHYASKYSSLSSVSASSASSVLKNMWDAVDEYSDSVDPTVFFEMSVTNADKPPLDPSEVERRVDMFATLEEEMPQDWAVILTNAPLFSQKTSILNNLIPSREVNDSFGSGNNNSNGNMNSNMYQRKMSFVLGTDTMVRIINPKYYGNSRDNMLDALVDMKEKGVHFIVGGRLEQGTDNRSKFVNGEEEVKSLPSDVQEMFTLLTEDEFRLDISSTELRKRLEQK